MHNRMCKRWKTGDECNGPIGVGSDSRCSHSLEFYFSYASCVVYLFTKLSGCLCSEITRPERAVRHHEAFDRYCIRQHRKFDVTEDEWTTMAGLCEWLKPFYLCTQQMSSSNVVTLSSTFIWFFDINDQLLKMKSSLSAASSERIWKGLERAQKMLLLPRHVQ